MPKLLASVLCAALALSAAPVSLMAAGKAARGLQAGQISGQATVDGKPLGNVRVRLRNVDTKQLAGEMQADGAGNFNFTGLPAGNYVVETIGANGNVLGTSTVVSLTATVLIAANVASVRAQLCWAQPVALPRRPQVWREASGRAPSA